MVLSIAVVVVVEIVLVPVPVTAVVHHIPEGKGCQTKKYVYVHICMYVHAI